MLRPVSPLAIVRSAALALACLGSAALADTVVLKNGDRLTGAVGSITAGKMEFTSPSLGKISIDMANVESFQTDAPVAATLMGEKARRQVTGGTGSELTLADGGTLPLARTQVVNPPPQAWTGSVVANAALARGNSDTLNVGVAADAALRRHDEAHNDRLSLTAQYQFQATGTGDDKTTTADNWSTTGKYDYFFSEQLYGYANLRYDRDRIADLNYRLAPGVGAGYQWIEQPAFRFNTEAGLSYVIEDYEDADTDDYLAVRLAYHLDKKLNDRLSLFHNLEWLPAIDDPGNFLLTTDLGLRATLTKKMFSEFRVEWKHDSEPAPGSEKNDLRFLLGVGWQF